MAQPLSREGSTVLEKQPDAVDAGGTEPPDPTRTPPPAVVVDGNALDMDEAAPQIVNILTGDGEETQSLASSVEVPVYNRAELLERYQVNFVNNYEMKFVLNY